jgi:dTDP-4-amino-4,6-dideoxygalactose transaminase
MYRGIASAHHDNLPVAAQIAGAVLCLPIYSTLSDDDVHRICDVIVEAGRQ